jgi:hypothetical protein
MKKTINDNTEKLHAMLGNLELPEVQMPAHQRQLREALLSSGHFAKKTAFPTTRHRVNTGKKMSLKLMSWRLVASLAAVILAFSAYSAFFITPKAVASLTLQVNPVVTLTLSDKKTVIATEGLDTEGEMLLAGLDITGKGVQVALRTIAVALHEAGLLGPGQRVIVALHAMEEGLTVEERLTVPEMSTLTENVRQALIGYMFDQGLPVEVKVVQVTAEMVDVARAIGLLPGDYVDFMDKVGYPLAKDVLKLQKELGIDPALFKEKLSTITAAKIDLLEAGIPAAAALDLLKTAMAADPKLQELTTITEAMVDLVEKGLSKEEALVKIRAAIKADPTLQNFDELIEIPEKEEVKEEEEALVETVKPKAINAGAVQPKVDAPEKEEEDVKRNGEAGKPAPKKPDADAPGPEDHGVDKPNKAETPEKEGEGVKRNGEARKQDSEKPDAPDQEPAGEVNEALQPERPEIEAEEKDADRDASDA